MPIIRSKARYDIALCRANPSLTFVFGDNLKRVGKGGQAVIRDEPNAHGVPTKRSPSMNSSAFFRDDDRAACRAVRAAINEVKERLEAGGDVVIPVTEDNRISLGLGLAQLDTHAPELYGDLVKMIEDLSQEYGERNGTGYRERVVCNHIR